MTKHSRKSSHSFKVRPSFGSNVDSVIVCLHKLFQNLARDCSATVPKWNTKLRSPNYNPRLYCLSWIWQPVFNHVGWSSLMQPIKFTVTGLIPCGWGVTNWRPSSDSELIYCMKMRLLASVSRGLSWDRSLIKL